MTGPQTESIGRYRLRRRIGSGAFATVWLADDPEFDITVAVKVLADDWAAEPDVRDRFLSEARILRRITDPRVVRVYDVGVGERDQPYFVMDYISGGTIAAKLAGRPEPVEALHLAAESALAVQALHDDGVLHRDVKPSNLLLARSRRGERVLISDLGTAKLLAEATGFTITTGTPGYMAPEQARGNTTIDVRADVYSLAVVGYELLAHERPFNVAALSDPGLRTADAKPEPIAERLGLPERLDDVFAAALSTNPDQRPATAGEFAAQLQELGQELSNEVAAAVEVANPADDATVSLSTQVVPSSDRRSELVREWRPMATLWLALGLFVASAVLAWLITQLLR